MSRWIHAGILTEGVPDLSAADSGTLSVLFKQLGPWLLTFGKNLLAALILFLIGRRLIQMVHKMLDRSMEHSGVEIGTARFLKALLNVCLYALLIFMMAGQMGINTASLVTVLGTASLAFSLALQGSLSNFAGGVLILIMHPFRVGDYIVCKEGEGTVSNIGLVYTTLASSDNKAITIPNGALSNITVTNVSAMEERRVDLSVGISYRSDLKKAKLLLEKICQENPAVRRQKGITVYVDSLGASAVMLGVRCWVAAEDYWSARWELTERIKLNFDEEGIDIPFQQLDVHVIN